MLLFPAFAHFSAFVPIEFNSRFSFCQGFVQLVYKLKAVVTRGARRDIVT
jgi:hypothetical protein